MLDKTNFTIDLRNQVFERDKGICQRCGKKLTRLIEPKKEAEEELLDTKEIPIYRWKHNCWKCNKETDIVTYDVIFLYNHSIGDIKKLDSMLMELYPFVKEIYSKTRQEKVIANTCVNCGALQGNFFVPEELLELYNNDKEKIDRYIPNILSSEDFSLNDEECNYIEKSSEGHVHHKDRNRNNNVLENLILLCINCHFKTHTELSKNIEENNILKDLKINGCSICGSYNQLVFHHINRTEKKFDINIYGIQKHNNNEIIEELQKCILLCNQCHYKTPERFYGKRSFPNNKINIC